MTIRLNVAEDTNKVIFHASDLQIDQKSVKLNDLEGRSITISEQFYDEDAQKYILTLGEFLQKDHQYILEIKFVAKINEQMQGFYRSQYRSNNETR